jgi:RNA polymerase sigma-B factor
VDATTENEERALFARLHTDPSQANHEAVVKRFLPLARALAARYSHSAEPLDDLQQVAAVGLLNAIDRFDPERGRSFSTFAVPTILGELRRHFRDRTWAMRVPRVLQELTLRLERARDELSSSMGRQPTLSELAHHVDADEDAVLQALELSLARVALSLDVYGAGEDEEPAHAPGRLDSGFARAEDRATLAPLLAALEPQEAEIVFLRFGEDLTQDVIAQRVGVSQMHVSRVLYRSIAKLRRAAEADAVNAR